MVGNVIELKPTYRFPFLLLGLMSLVAGLFTGIARLGIQVPGVYQSISGMHSALMISAFFGTIIGLERAVATRYLWAYLAPLMSGLGGLVLVFIPEAIIVPILFTLSSLVFTCASATILKKQRALFTYTLFIAGALWLAGNLFWLASGSLWSSIPFGLAFLIVTIAGERLELTRFMKPNPIAARLFALILLAIVGGGMMSSVTNFQNNVLYGSALCGLSIWLIRFDIARKTIFKEGITRFVAVCLLSGYFWLFAGGLLFATGDLSSLAYQKDAGIHAVALGFIFSMVIGHSPIIFPAIMRVSIPFSTLLYIPLGLLQLGVALRIMAVATQEGIFRVAGGVLNEAAILLFIATLILQVFRGRRQRVLT